MEVFFVMIFAERDQMSDFTIEPIHRKRKLNTSRGDSRPHDKAYGRTEAESAIVNQPHCFFAAI